MKKWLKLLFSIFSAIVILFFSFFFAYSITPESAIENVNLDVFLSFDYFIDKENIPSIDNIKIDSMEIIFADDNIEMIDSNMKKIESSTILIYNFIILESEERIEKGKEARVSKEKILQNGFLRLYFKESNHRNFKIESARIFSAYSEDPFDKSRYISLVQLKNQTDYCHEKETCFGLENVAINGNKFSIVLEFPSIFEEKDIFHLYRNIKSNYKRISILLRGSYMSRLDNKSIFYGIKISVPPDATFIYYTFPAEQRFHYKLLMKTLDMTLENIGLHGEMEIYTLDTKLLLGITSLFFSLFALFFSLFFYVERIFKNDDKNISNKDSAFSSEQELELYLKIYE